MSFSYYFFIFNPILIKDLSLKCKNLHDIRTASIFVVADFCLIMPFYRYVPSANEVLFACFQWFISYRNHSGN